MFHTWETSAYQNAQHNDGDTVGSGKRRTSTVRACEPCRKRKIRCNGESPCDACIWYKKSPSCHYTEPRQRQIPTRRSLEKIAEDLQTCRGVLQKLIPGIPPEQLKSLGRDALLELVSKTSPGSYLSPPSPVTPLDEKPPAISPEAANLEQLQPIPDEATDGTESRSSGLKGITDDVNALSLSVKKSTSYLGISSVTAVLRVILWLDPEAQNFFSKTPDRSIAASRETSSPPEESTLESTTPKGNGDSSVWDEIPLINAYFRYIHPLAPLLDEQDFRDTYMTRSRTDPRWWLLLNTVLALGSMANSSHCDEHGHKIYWRRAKQYLTIDTIGVAHIEVVQALALISGLLLHYLQQPNLAHALMGAALRLATTIGLHRDYTEGVNPRQRESAGKSIELRRRVWWSLFVLDSWACYGLGRPSMGRMSHAISAKLPQEPLQASSQVLQLAQENIRFCIISTKMEDLLANSPIIPEAERRSIDNSFVEWFQNSSVKNNTPRAMPGEAHGVSVTKNVMRWRYLLCRILAHRPVLLWAAMRRAPFSELPEDKRFAVEICRETTFELINDIASTWRVSRPCATSGWHATWLLYQALMVPLLHLFADRSNELLVEKNQTVIEVGLNTFVDLRSWSQTATRSAEAIQRIYQASKRHNLPNVSQGSRTGNWVPGLMTNNFEQSHEQTSFITPLQVNTGDPLSQEMYMDNMFDSLNWSNNLVDERFPYMQNAVNWGEDQNNIMSYDAFMSPSEWVPDPELRALDQTISQGLGTAEHSHWQNYPQYQQP